VSTSSGHWRVRSPPRRRRLWSALLGGILLVAGFGRRPADLERTNVPELAKGRPRGHAATKARRAWMEIARLLYSAIGEHRVVSIAAGVTFFVLLAIFPAIGALVSIYGIFADPATIQAQLNNLSSLLPGGAIETIGDQLQRVTSGVMTTLPFSSTRAVCLCQGTKRSGVSMFVVAIK
jgi:membrane protein